MTHATLGLRAHSGWAALVAVAGTRKSIAVIDRRRIGIADPEIAGSKQPYHAAEKLDIEKAGELVRRCEHHARRLAREALREVIGDLRKKGHEVVGCGLLLASGRPLPGLAAILASHALIHTADGEHFRDALTDACEHFKLPVTPVREKELHARVSAELLIPIEELQRRVNELGKSIGPPWTQDQKLAALVAWLALAHRARQEGT